LKRPTTAIAAFAIAASTASCSLLLGIQNVTGSGSASGSGGAGGGPGATGSGGAGIAGGNHSTRSGSSSGVGGGSGGSGGAPPAFLKPGAWAAALDGIEQPNGVAALKDGGVIVVGTTTSGGPTNCLGFQVYMPAGADDIGVLRFDKNGACNGVYHFAGPGDDLATGVVATPDGKSVVMVGSIDAALDFGCGTLDPGGTTQGFVVTFDISAGLTCTKSVLVPGTYYDGVAIDAAGNLLLAGNDTMLQDGLFVQPMTKAGVLGGRAMISTATPAGHHDYAGVALARSNVGGPGWLGVAYTQLKPLGQETPDSLLGLYDPASGTFTAAVTYAMGNDEQAYGAAAVSDGSLVAIAGNAFTSALHPMIHAADPATLAVQWSVLLGGAGDGEAYGLAGNTDHGVTAVGRFTGALDLGITATATDGFVAALDASGAVRWWGHITDGDANANDQIALGVDTSAAGDTFVIGTFIGTVDAGGPAGAPGNTTPLGFVVAFPP
jgi:hypothetical protein